MRQGFTRGCRAANGQYLNLAFQGLLLPLMQRVNEWNAISVTHREIFSKFINS